MSLQTGLIFDESMADYSCLWDPSYVENPERFRCVLKRFQELNLVQRCVNLKPREASKAELRMAHSEELIEALEATRGMEDVEKLKELAARYDCLYLHPSVYSAALLSPGCAIELTDAVLTGKLRNGFGLLRPPGHHAMTNDSCGYCFFNNIVMAARHALNKGTNRILIVDWDVHHGQGTQRAFYDDPRVLYFSIHRYEFGSWWPELRESDFDHVGDGPGKGFNVNIPLNKIGNKDADYMAAFLQVLLPLAIEFDPELVLVSAGFDPAYGCPEGEQEVTPPFFSHLANLVNGLGSGKCVALLEGGYCLNSLAESAALTLKTLLGDPCPLLSESLGEPCKEMDDVISGVKLALKPYWKCFQGSCTPNTTLTAELKYLGNPVGPPYDIMCPTPPRSTELEESLQAHLRMLKDNTNLAFSDSKLAFGNHDTDGSLEQWMWPLLEDKAVTFVKVRPALQEQLEWLKIHHLDLEEKEANFSSVGCIFQTLEEVLSGRSQAGIAWIDHSSERQMTSLAPFYAKENHSVDRILLINLEEGHSHGDDNESHLPQNLVQISISSREENEKVLACSKECVNIKFQEAADGGNQDIDFLNALHRIVLPIGYEFQPNLVIVYSSLASTWISSKGMSLFLHHLSALANGKIFCIFEGGTGPFDNPRILSCVANALIKKKSDFTAETVVQDINSRNSKSIETARQKWQDFWMSLKCH